eukprot:565782-Hanusia_phi.AAC.1
MREVAKKGEIVVEEDEKEEEAQEGRGGGGKAGGKQRIRTFILLSELPGSERTTDKSSRGQECTSFMNASEWGPGRLGRANSSSSSSSKAEEEEQ